MQEFLNTLDYSLTRESNLWVWKEAWKLKQKFEQNPPKKGFVLFETGYGPSGLPHIGTFGEVFRTTMVKNAFEKISNIPTKLIAFSDDMDGLRKVPENLPNKEMIEANLGKPLTAIPDPFGEAESFGAYMNNRLRRFLDSYGFDYEFKSATTAYRSGEFDEALRAVLQNYDKIMAIMLPTLGEERQKTYSPFLPICQKTGKVLQAKVVNTDVVNSSITFIDEDGEEITTKVTGGNCKLQWKPDWGMRWAALGVDFEMHGKDLTPSVAVSSQITKAIGAKSPLTFVYEMFLDEKGEKISKSKGNGISIDEWLEYGTQDSLALYMFNAPQKAKRLYFDVIPQQTDDYLKHAENLVETLNSLSKTTEISTADYKKIFDNPAFHIQSLSADSNIKNPISFSLLLNLASACNPEDESILWGFIRSYDSSLTPEEYPYLNQLAGLAVRYYHDFVKPKKSYHKANANEKSAILALRQRLVDLQKSNPNTTQSMSADELQTVVFSIGKENGYQDNLRDWFSLLYMVLLGQTQGPRFGSFIKLFGLTAVINLIDEKL